LKPIFEGFSPRMGFNKENVKQVLGFLRVEVLWLALIEAKGVTKELAKLGLDDKAISIDEKAIPAMGNKDTEAFEVLEKRLAPHLLNPKMARLYADVCFRHFVALENDNDNRPILLAKVMLWAKRAADEEDGKAALIAAECQMAFKGSDPQEYYLRCYGLIKLARNFGEEKKARILHAELRLQRHLLEPNNKDYKAAAIDGYKQLGKEGVALLEQAVKLAGNDQEFVAAHQAARKKYGMDKLPSKPIQFFEMGIVGRWFASRPAAIKAWFFSFAKKTRAPESVPAQRLADRSDSYSTSTSLVEDSNIEPAQGGLSLEGWLEKMDQLTTDYKAMTKKWDDSFLKRVYEGKTGRLADSQNLGKVETWRDKCNTFAPTISETRTKLQDGTISLDEAESVVEALEREFRNLDTEFNQLIGLAD